MNIRLAKDLTLAGGRKMTFSGDVFNLNVSAATGFPSADARSSNFGIRTNYVPARVGQLGVRLASETVRPSLPRAAKGRTRHSRHRCADFHSVLIEIPSTRRENVLW